MKEIDSKPFGKIQIDERQIVEFPEGLFGFDQNRSFAVIEESPDTVFKWLQSLDDPELAFVLIQPHIFLSEYRPLVPPSELKMIGLDSAEKAVQFLIVTIPASDPKKMTANLQGPILIHPETRLAKQFISRDENHPLRKLILETEEPGK